MDHVDGHRYFEGLAVAHVLGGLDDSEGRVFRSHLLECGNCRARVGELRAIAHDLADVERDERRVRAAQAIDTKRREAEDEAEEDLEPPPSPRSSRITIIVGLTLIIGLSLWNFTLRGALTIQEGHNRDLVTMAAISETGEEWTVVRTSPGVDGAVHHKDDQVVITVADLDSNQVYGLYVQDADGVVTFSDRFKPQEGRVSQLLNLQHDAVRITLRNPDDADGKVTVPGDRPAGSYVFEAVKP